MYVVDACAYFLSKHMQFAICHDNLAPLRESLEERGIGFFIIIPIIIYLDSALPLALLSHQMQLYCGLKKNHQCFIFLLRACMPSGDEMEKKFASSYSRIPQPRTGHANCLLFDSKWWAWTARASMDFVLQTFVCPLQPR